jgi:hypothetical protein
MMNNPGNSLRLAIVAVSSLLVAACGGVACERPERYAGAASIAPIEVPEGMAAPDTDRAMRIPPAPLEEPRRVSRRGACLESPPDFFDRPLLEN